MLRRSRVCRVLLGLILLPFLYIFWVFRPLYTTYLFPPNPVHPPCSQCDGEDNISTLLPVSVTHLTNFPKVIHHIFLNYSGTPKDFTWCTDSCKIVNKDFEFIQWNASMVENLIRRRYPWFIETYLSYPYGIQRADVARYFILHSYGGTYMDMDTSCYDPLEELLGATSFFSQDSKKLQCLFPAGDPKSVSQWTIICQKEADFLSFMITRLPRFPHWYFVHYLTIMLSTGPLFVTICYLQYQYPEEIYVIPEHQWMGYFKNRGFKTWLTWDGEKLSDFYFHDIPKIKYRAKTYKHRIFGTNLVIMCLVLCIVSFRCHLVLLKKLRNRHRTRKCYLL